MISLDFYLSYITFGFLQHRWTLELADSKEREMIKNQELNIVFQDLRTERANRNFLQEKYELLEISYQNQIRKTEYHEIEMKKLNQINLELRKKYSIYEKYKKSDDNDQENYFSQITFLQKSLDDLEGIEVVNVELTEEINELKEEIINLNNKNKCLQVKNLFHFIYFHSLLFISFHLLFIFYFFYKIYNFIQVRIPKKLFHQISLPKIKSNDVGIFII